MYCGILQEQAMFLQCRRILVKASLVSQSPNSIIPGPKGYAFHACMKCGAIRVS
mgnify:CR=1 FL=1